MRSHSPLLPQERKLLQIVERGNGSFSLYLPDWFSAPTSFETVAFSFDFNVSSGAVQSVGGAHIVECKQQMKTRIRLDHLP